jgi:hypothetical protein
LHVCIGSEKLQPFSNTAGSNASLEEFVLIFQC